MKLPRDIWRKALILEKEFNRRGEKLGRKKLEDALQIPTSLAQRIVFALENKDVIKLEPMEFAPVKTEFIIADLHIPYHDPLAVESALSYAERVKPDLIVILGDLIDFYKISTFVKNPTKKGVAEEIKETKKFLEELRERFGDIEIIYKEGNHECVKWDTEILTKDGWKLAVDITEKDEVAQFDLETGEITFATPYKVSKQFVDRWVEVKTNQGHEAVTLNHALVIDKKRVPVSEAIGKGFTQTQQYYAGILNNRYRQPSDLSLDWIRLLTWVIMDGTWVIVTEGKMRVQFKLSKPRKIKALTELLDKMQIPYTFRKATKSKHNKLQPYMIRIYGRYARDIINALHRKQFPKDWAFKLNYQQVMAIIETIKQTDGSKHFNHVTWSSISKHNMDVLQLACIFNGIPFKYKPRKYNAGFATKREVIYYASIYPNGLAGSHGKFVVHNERTMVVAITTPKETLITRYNGKVNFTGNSRIQRYLMKNAPEIYSLIDNLLPVSLGLDKLNIEYVVEPFRIGKLWHLHGHERAGGSYNPEYITNVMWKYVHDHFIVGHFHRTQEKVFKRIDGKNYWGGAVGYLAKELDYATLNNWTQGFAIVRYAEDGTFRAELRRIVNGEVF